MKGIEVKILGDCGPFSSQGVSISYLIKIGSESFLIDCGSPIFQLMGWEEIGKLNGLIITHSHEDHKRWFTDLALFRFYVMPKQGKIKVYTTDTIHEELFKTSKAALERSLSQDSTKVIEAPYHNFVDSMSFGPTPKYKILHERLNETPYLTKMKIIDENGKDVPPSKAKIFLHPSTSRPRMLFKDPEKNIWVEPEHYYPFKSETFYKEDFNPINGTTEEFSILPVKSSAWHGLPCCSVQIKTKDTSLLFSSDTNYNPEIWKHLAFSKRKTEYKLSKDEFEEMPLIIGDINDYIDYYWSEERYEIAMDILKSNVIIHDVATYNSVVHTDYNCIKKIECKNIMVVHSPDRFISTQKNSFRGKKYYIEGNDIYDKNDNGMYYIDADIFFKLRDRFFVGYKNQKGKFKIIEKENEILDIISATEETKYKEIFRVDLFEDIDGKYYHYIESTDTMFYSIRPDKQVELRTISPDGSKGTIVKPLPRKEFKMNEN